MFRSGDSGETWEDVTVGLPSFHGFPIAVTHREPDAAYVVPLDYGQDNFRVALGQFAVYRTEDSGKSWQALTKGLPGPNDYQSVYREGLDTDGLDSGRRVRRHEQRRGLRQRRPRRELAAAAGHAAARVERDGGGLRVSKPDGGLKTSATSGAAVPLERELLGRADHDLGDVDVDRLRDGIKTALAMSSGLPRVWRSASGIFSKTASGSR